MYLVGRQMGGDPKKLGELISTNMNEVLQLRERRQQATITLIGLLYGITAAASFAFYIGIQVVAILANMSLDLDAGNTAASQLINTASYDIPFIKFLVLVVILFNALLSSLMIRTADGGHKANSYLHFVMLTWIGALVGLVVQLMVSSLLDV
jgi:flagellar protein FlaJ